MEGWHTIPLGDACTLQRGFDLPKKQRQEGTYPLISSSGCIDSHIESKVAGPGVVTGRSGSIGSVYYVEKDFWPLNTTLYVKDFHGNDPEFICYLLRKFDLNRFVSGAGVPTLNRNNVHSELVKIPKSLPEQKRIVTILDEAFAGIDAAVANTENNLANARELFESYLNAVFTQKGDGWVEKTLGEYSASISTGPFGSLLHKSDYVSEGVPLVNPINIIGRDIVPNNSKLIDEETKKRLQSYVLHGGNIVIARRGEIGRCAVIDREHDGWVCGTGCFFMQPLPSVNPHFLANLIRSQGYREKLERAATGATMKNLSNKTLSNLTVSIPNLEKQTEILANFDALAGETQRLETIYQKKLEALAELKQSILQKAFAGELTTLPEKTLKEAVA